jgi:hypothetical protein
MKKLKLLTILIPLILSTTLTAQVKANLTIRNYIKTDMMVYLESYDSKGNLKVNESFIVDKSLVTDGVVSPTTKVFTTKGYKGGNIKIKYNPAESNTKFTLDPIQVPNNNSDLNQSVALTGLALYDVNDNKKRLISLGTDLKFDSTTTFTRLIDVKQQLGSLVIGKRINNKLVIIDVIPLKNIDITYDKTSRIQETTVIEKSVVSNLKVAVPIYGSVEAMMSNSDLNQVKWDISYYPFLSNASFSQLVTDLDVINKTALIKKLKTNDTALEIFILRSFDVIESGIFSVTTGTKINIEGNAAIASVFTANAAYAFKSEDSKFVSIPNQAYNLGYVKWQTVGELIQNLESKILHLPTEETLKTNVLTPQIAK